MVYVDQPFTAVSKDPQAKRVGARHGHQWCHLWADTQSELHTFASKLRMRYEWFQDHPVLPHYDLVPSRRKKAIALGAVEMAVADYLRGKRDAKPQ